MIGHLRARDALDDAPAGVGVEATELDGRGRRGAELHRRAAGHDQEHRALRDRRDEPVDDLEARRVEPMRVLDHEEESPGGAERRRDEVIVELSPELGRHRRVRASAVQHRRAHELAHERRDVGVGRLGCVVALVAEALDEGMERHVAVVHRPREGQHGNAILADRLAQLLHEARLADAGVADHRDRATRLRADRAPLRQQAFELALAADERHLARRSAPRIGAIALALDLERHDLARQAAQDLRPERTEVEAVAQQRRGGIADDDAVRPRDGLKARGDVRGFADQRAGLQVTVGAHLANHHEPGLDPDAYRGRLAEPLLQVLRDDSHAREDRQRRAHGRLRTLLDGYRVAELGHHAVARVVRHLPLEAHDLLDARLLARLQDVAHVLGVLPLRQARRVDQVAEEHRELPALAAEAIAVGRVSARAQGRARSWNVATRAQARRRARRAPPRATA